MIRLREIVVVEGKYDAIRLHSVLDALIIETGGFSIFHDAEKQTLLRRLAEEHGVLVLTDSDSAGFVIRDFLSGILSPEKIKHAYIPEIPGKERRKTARSKEGLLGVEGVDATVIEQAIRCSGVVPLGETAPDRTAFLCKADLYADGLSGKPESAKKRRRFLAAAGLPSSLSTNRLLAIINKIMTEKQYRELLEIIS